MNAEQLVKVTTRYYREMGMLNKTRVARWDPAKRVDSMAPPTAAAMQEAEMLAHLRFMCLEINKELQHTDMEKAMRWLGFIQGTLWAMGIKTIEQMREDNR